MDLLSPKIILLVKNRALGDSIMGLSTVSYLRSLYPESKIVYGVPEWVAPLYSQAETEADEILPLNFSTMGNWWKMWWKIKKLNPDHIHEMHLAGRSQKFFELYSSFNGVRYTFHNHHLKEKDDNSFKVHDQGVIKALIQRDLDGVWTAFDKSSEPPSYLQFEPTMKITDQEKMVPQNSGPFIFGVVATRETKMWPLKYYVELAQLLKESGAQVTIPLSGNATDQAIEKELQNLGLPDNCTILKSPLDQLPSHLKNHSHYIGNDTGLKHLAIALGIKTYTFFGPEPPKEWHPYDEQKHPYFYRDGLECRTEKAHYCGLSQCDSMICLNQISPQQVMEKVQKDMP